MGKSLKSNFGFNLVNILSGLLYPLITFPYASRVLMPSGIGQIQFYQSIINYIALFSALGIPLYAVKEIAKVRDDVIKRNQTAIEILVLYVILSVGGYLIIGGLSLFVDKIQEGLVVFLLLSSHLILVAIGAEWFYQGVEDFKYITIRSLCIRIISLICLFLFVKKSDDLIVYAGLLVLAEAGNNLLNFIHLRHYISFNGSLKHLNITRHIKPALVIFALNLIVSVYVNLDSVMLGFMSSNESVGFYSAATKLTRTLMGIATALGGVLLPYLSNEYNKGNIHKYEAMANKAISYMITIYLPLAVGVYVTSPQLIPLFCGESFIPSILTLQILAPIILFLSISSILGTRVLYAQNLEKIVIRSTLMGAVVNLILNILLIPRLSQNGAAVASVIAEFCVTASMVFLCRNHLRIKLLTRANLFVLLFSIIMCIPVFIIQRLDLPNLKMFLFEVLSAIFVYLVLLIFSRNELIVEAIKFVDFKKRN